MKLMEAEGKKLKIFINIFVLALSLYTVSKREYDFDKLSAFDKLMIESFAPIQRFVSSTQLSLGSFFDDYLANVSASQENQELKKKIQELEARLFTYEEMEHENERLKDLLDFSSDIAQKKVLAQVVAWDAASDFQTLRINKGLSDGLSLQSTVVTARGLVGYVYRLTNHFADVLTILDPNNRTDVLIQRTRSHGILEGYRDGRTLMKYVTRTEPVILGDEVLTSGLGNIYPKGIPIGDVGRIERESYGITQHIEVIPGVDFSRLEEVLVLVRPNDESRRKEWQALDMSDVEGEAQ